MGFGNGLSRCLMLAVAVTIVPVPLAAQTGSLRVQRIASPAIADNLLGEPSDVEVAVYTPPGYRDSGLRYPVLYLLHGIGGTYRDWTGGGYQGLRIHTELDSLIEVGVVPPMIVVMPTAMNRYAGSYYADSPVTGNWGEFVARELVQWVDTTYRTLPAPVGRGIAGHSMGGFGALTLAMDHPGVYSAVFAMSPCCLKLSDDLGAGNSGWQRALTFDSHDDIPEALREGEFYPVVFMGLISLATPNEGNPPFYVDYPYRLDTGGALVRSEPAHSRYRSFFPFERLGATAHALRGLRGLALDVGHDDEFSHIVPAALAFSQRLGELAISHTFMMYDGDHRNRLRGRFVSIVLPFFAKHLDPSRP